MYFVLKMGDIRLPEGIWTSTKQHLESSDVAEMTFFATGDYFLQGGRGGWRWGYPLAWIFFVVFFFFGVFEKEVIVAYLFWNWMETSLKICWWTKLLHQHIQHMLHQETMNCLCLNQTFLQPGGTGFLVHPSCTYPAHQIRSLLTLLRRRHQQLPDPLRRPIKVNRLH